MLGGFIKPTHLADFLRQRSALVSGHIMDDWRAWLRSQGAKGYNTHDLEIQWLRGQGYTGTFADMFYAKFGDRDGARAFFKDGGEWTPFAKTTFLNATTDRGSLRKVELSGLSTQAGTPTPDAPVPIVSTTGDVTVKSDSKNLIIVSRRTSTISGVTFTVNADGSITANGTASAQIVFQTGVTTLQYIPYVAGQQYTLTGSVGGSASTYFIEVVATPTGGGTSFFADQFSAAYTHTAAFSGMASAYIVIRSGITVSNQVFKPQFEVGSTATTFEKNITSTQTLPLGTTKLRSLPNGVSDRIYKDGSTWKLEQNVGNVIYNGTESWTDVSDASGSTTYRFTLSGQAYPNTVLDTTAARTNMFARSFPFYANDEVSYYNSNNQFVTKPLKTTIDAVAGANVLAKWKAFLATTNLVYNFAQTTPTTTTITDTTLITALENIRTYQGVTNITAPTPFSGEYPS